MSANRVILAAILLPQRLLRERMESASNLLTSLSSESTAYAESPGLGAVQLLEFMRAFQDGKQWYAGPLQGTALAQKAIRTLLWDAYASHPTLFQAALFISGTHSNSCGLPPTAVHHMGSGMLVLRGASLDSIQAAVFASDATDASSTPIAIALLAGWERRYGDPESYAVHMNAWRSLSLPAKALEENNVSTLTEVTLEIFRGALDERSFVSPSEVKVASTASASNSQRRLPLGFKVFNVARPEVRSLLMLIAIVNAFKPNDLSMMPARRKLGLEILAWSPTHTISAGPVPWAEESYDQLELNALYHARAALISINGTIYRKTLDTLKIAMMFQIQAALDVHCVSCQHLNTDALLGTKYEELAFWSRFTLCAISRDPDRDGYIKRLLHALRLDSWEKVKATSVGPFTICLWFYRNMSRVGREEYRSYLDSPNQSAVYCHVNYVFFTHVLASTNVVYSSFAIRGLHLTSYSASYLNSRDGSSQRITPWQLSFMLEKNAWKADRAKRSHNTSKISTPHCWIKLIPGYKKLYVKA
ncbi:hypothetical protein KC320_g168 [Hortaea werneckii]|nr:hypothetical protein KC320_g168 [Hortaea werneckii]